MKKGVLSNFARSHISSDRVRSGYEITCEIVRCVQNECFPEDVKELKKNKEFKKSSRLVNLRRSTAGSSGIVLG